MKLLPKILALSLAMVVTTSVAANQLANEKTAISVNYKNNRYPLLQKPYIELPIGSIRPTGWMQEQLVRMKNGMTGNLDQVYEKVMGPRNGWLGGDGDVWERGPYWIDGLLPLAYILNDQALIDKVKPVGQELGTFRTSPKSPNGLFRTGYRPELRTGITTGQFPGLVA